MPIAKAVGSLHGLLLPGLVGHCDLEGAGGVGAADVFGQGQGIGGNNIGVGKGHSIALVGRYGKDRVRGTGGGYVIALQGITGLLYSDGLVHQVADGDGFAQLPVSRSGLAPLPQFIGVDRPENRTTAVVNQVELHIRQQCIEGRFLQVAVEMLADGQLGIGGRRRRSLGAEPHVVNVVADGFIVRGGRRRHEEEGGVILSGGNGVGSRMGLPGAGVGVCVVWPPPIACVGACPLAFALAELTVCAGIVHPVHNVLAPCDCLRHLEYLRRVTGECVRLRRIHNDNVHGVRAVIAGVSAAGTRHVIHLPRHGKSRCGDNLLI